MARKRLELFLRFPDQSESFVHGYEAGRICDRMSKGDPEVSNDGLPVHAQNVDLLTEACKKFGYLPCFKECYYEGWIEFKAIKQSQN